MGDEEGEPAYQRPILTTIYNGNTYIGEVDDTGLPEGHGKMQYADDSVHVGHWAKGIKNGEGEYTSAIGEVYRGTWVKDIRVGHGYQSYANGDVYTGDWKDDKPNGTGIMQYRNGNTFDGHWDDGVRIEGTLTYANKDTYTGQFKLGNREGKGKQVYFESGSIYEGAWSADKRHGEGVINFKDGSRHVGRFQNDKTHGPGAFFYPDKDWYQGEWHKVETLPSLPNFLALVVTLVAYIAHTSLCLPCRMNGMVMAYFTLQIKLRSQSSKCMKRGS
ncbi:unnamed protein product [Chrysoparadoxa australica]